MNLTAKQTRMQEQILKKLYGVGVFEDGKHWYLANQGTISLPRVLQALGDIYFFYNGRIRKSLGGAIGEYCSLSYERKKKIERKLLNSDNTDCTLFGQDQSTQDAIALLLGRED